MSPLHAAEAIMARPPHSLFGATLALARRQHSRAAELLIAAAAHRTSVEHWLAGGQRQWSSRTAGNGPEMDQQLLMAEMIEAWMTGEDAVEVASWHMKAAQGAITCDRASRVLEETFNEVFK